MAAWVAGSGWAAAQGLGFAEPLLGGVGICHVGHVQQTGHLKTCVGLDNVVNWSWNPRAVQQLIHLQHIGWCCIGELIR